MKLLIIFSMCAWAQVEQPGLGWMIDGASSLQPVLGVASSVTAADPVASGVLSFGCSQARCLIKTGREIGELGTDAAVPAPPGPAIFDFTAHSVRVYFPETRQLAEWRNGRLQGMELTLDGEVLSIHGPYVAIRGDGGTSIIRNGDIVASIPEATGPVMLLDHAVLFAAGDQVVLRHDDRSEARFDVAGAEAFFQMSDRYVQIRAGAFSYALRIEPGREALFILPEAAR